MCDCLYTVLMGCFLIAPGFYLCLLSNDCTSFCKYSTTIAGRITTIHSPR